MDELDRTDFSLSTKALCDGLFKADSLSGFFQSNVGELCQMPFCEYITKLCIARGDIPEHVLSRANIESSFGHQLFKGTRKPSRDTVLQLAFGFEADHNAAQTLLQYAGKSPLYPRIKRDAAIIYCLHNHLSFVNAQALLHELGLPLMGSNRK